MREGGRGRRERKGVSLLQLSPFFASIFPLFPQKRLTLRLTYRKKANTQKRGHILIKLRVSIIIWVSAASSTASPWDHELACVSEARFNLLFRVLLEVGLVQFSHHKELFQTKNPFKNFASNSCHSFSFCDETKEFRFHWLIYQGVMKEHNGTSRLVEYGPEEYITQVHFMYKQ